jgi:hypothetical protein
MDGSLLLPAGQEPFFLIRAFQIGTDFLRQPPQVFPLRNSFGADPQRLIKTDAPLVLPF